MSTQKLWHGGEEQAALLASGLQARGHRCVIFARRRSEFAERMAGRGFHVSTFSGRGRLPHAAYSIRRQLDDANPDLFYLNDPHALTAYGFSQLGRKRQSVWLRDVSTLPCDIRFAINDLLICLFASLAPYVMSVSRAASNASDCASCTMASTRRASNGEPRTWPSVVASQRGAEACAYGGQANRPQRTSISA